jgi:hypothetical protein
MLLRGKGAQKKKIEALRALRRLLSQSEVPPIEVAIKAGAVPLLVQFLSFGSSDEQVDHFALEKYRLQLSTLDGKQLPCYRFSVMQLDVFIICIAFVSLSSFELFVLWGDH